MKYCVVCKKDEASLEMKELLLKKIKLSYDEKKPNIVIAVGGDGTLIRATHTFPNAIIFGVHTGHLGFYTNYTRSELNDLITDINNGSYKIEDIDVLACELKTEDKIVSAYALNEMTIIMPPRTLILDVYINENKLETFRGTGLCISTPHGSTAYNKSLQGAVIDASIKAIQMTEIAGINSNAYRTLSSPLVLSKEKEIVLKSKTEEEIYITIDNLSYPLSKFKEAKISLKEKAVRFGYSKKIEYVDRLKRTFL